MEKLGYSVDEACEAIPSGRTKLYELIALGLLDARKMGKKLIITAESIHAYHAALPKADIRAPTSVQRAMERGHATTQNQ